MKPLAIIIIVIILIIVFFVIKARGSATSAQAAAPATAAAATTPAQPAGPAGPGGPGTFPCVRDGVTVKAPWYSLAAGDAGKCYAPAGQKCCTPDAKGCSADFNSDGGYNGKRVMDWMAACGI